MPELEGALKYKGLGIKTQARSDLIEDLYARTGTKTRESMG